MKVAVLDLGKYQELHTFVKLLIRLFSNAPMSKTRAVKIIKELDEQLEEFQDQKEVFQKIKGNIELLEMEAKDLSIGEFYYLKTSCEKITSLFKKINFSE